MFKLPGGPRKTLPGGSLKYQFVYCKNRIFRCSYRDIYIYTYYIYIYTYTYIYIYRSYTLCTVYLTMQSPLFVGNVVIYRWLYPHCLPDKTYDMARMTWPARPAKASWPWLSPQPGTMEVLVMGRSAGPFTVLVPAKIAQFRMNL